MAIYATLSLTAGFEILTCEWFRQLTLWLFRDIVKREVEHYLTWTFRTLLLSYHKKKGLQNAVCVMLWNMSCGFCLLLFFFTILSTCDLHIQCQKCKHSSHMSVGSKFYGSVAMVLFVLKQSSVQKFIFLCRNDTSNWKSFWFFISIRISYTQSISKLG